MCNRPLTCIHDATLYTALARTCACTLAHTYARTLTGVGGRGREHDRASWGGGSTQRILENQVGSDENSALCPKPMESQKHDVPKVAAGLEAWSR